MAGTAPFDEWTSRWRVTTPVGTADALRSWQLERAWDIAERLADVNTFYRDRLKLPEERTAEAFRSIGTTVKSEVVDDCNDHPPYGSRTAVDPRRISHIVETSGTSGKGREIYALDARDEQAILEAEAVGFWWAGVRPGSTVLMTLPIGMSAAGVWYYGGLRTIGANVLNVGMYPTERKVQILERYGADVVIATPSYFDRLATEFEEQGVDPCALGVRSLVTAGEPFTVDWVRRMEKRWGGATLYEQYGSTERILAWTCPGGVVKDDELGVLHVPAELAYWEVLDPTTNEPVPDGEFGELITTPLQAESSPLLRFATRDRVRYVAAGSCPCGRPLPGIRAGRVERYDGMMKIRGVNVWPATFDEVILAVTEVATYRGVVSSSGTSGESIRIEVEPRVNASEGLALMLRQAVLSRTGLNVDVALLPVGQISAATVPGVKVVRWRDEREGRS